MMRLVLALVCCLYLAASPVAAEPVEEVARIGFLSPLHRAQTLAWDQAFRQGLRELGWVDGRNIIITYRFADGRTDRLPALASELVRAGPALIVALNSLSASAVQRSDPDMPIVIPYAADPVRQGLGAKLAAPGGNITGLSEMVPEMSGKRLQLLKEIVPGLIRVAVLWDPGNRASKLAWEDIQAPGRRLGLELQSLPVRTVGAFESAFADAAQRHSGAIAIMPATLFGANLETLAALAIRYRLPTIWHRSEFPDAGGFLSYGPNRTDLFRRAAVFVHKILKGATPADLPIEQAARFYLTINRKTARTLGIAIPRSILLRADQVIE